MNLRSGNNTSTGDSSHPSSRSRRNTPSPFHVLRQGSRGNTRIQDTETSSGASHIYRETPSNNMNPNNDEEHPLFPNGFYPSNNGNHAELSLAAMLMLNSHQHPNGSAFPSRRASAPASYEGASFTNNNEFNMGSSFQPGGNSMGASLHQHQVPFSNQGMIPNHGSPMRNSYSSGQGVAAAASPHHQMNHTRPSGQRQQQAQQPSVAATHAAAVRLSLPLPISFPMHFSSNVPATLGIELSLPTNASTSAQSRHPFPPSQFDNNSASLSSPEESDFLAEAILRLHSANMPNSDLASRRASADQILLNGIANSMSHRDSFLSNMEPLQARPPPFNMDEAPRNNDQGHHEFASSLWNDFEQRESIQTTEFDSVLDDDDDEISIANPNILREMLLGDDTLHEPRSQSAVSAPQGRRQTTVNSAPASSYTKQEDKHNEVVKPLSPCKTESNEEDGKKSILKDQNSTPKISRKRTRSPSPERKRPASGIDENCCICLETTTAYDLAKIDGCEHRYCFTCIEKWAERENTCPQCKARFLKIERVHKVKKQKNEPNEVENVKEVNNRDQRSDLRSHHLNLQDFFESFEQHALQGFNIVFSNGGPPNFDGPDFPGIFMPIGGTFSFGNGPASWTTTTTRMFPGATSFTSTRTTGDLSSPSIRTTHQLTSIRRMQRERLQRERNARRAAEETRFMRERAARIAAMETRRRSNDSNQSSPNTRIRDNTAFSRFMGNGSNPGNNQEQR